MVVTQLPSPPGAETPGGAAGGPSGPPVLRLGAAAVRLTGRRDGDLADPAGNDPVVRQRQRAVLDRPWTVLRQVHGAAVAIVDVAGGAAGRAADAAVSAAPGTALAILTADCAPVALASPEGVIGVAHAGWRGLLAGVIEETVGAMRRLGATSVSAGLGPCIHAECYAFGPAALDQAAARLGDVVRARTAGGEPSLDIPRAVRVALERAGAHLAWDAGVCTACSSEHWSWRARQERQRQATVVWRP